MGKYKHVYGGDGKKGRTPQSERGTDSIEKAEYEGATVLQSVPMIADIGALPIRDAGEDWLERHGWKFAIQGGKAQQIVIMEPGSKYIYGIDLKWAGLAAVYLDNEYRTVPLEPDDIEANSDGEGWLIKPRTRFKPRAIATSLALFIMGRFREVMDSDPDAKGEPVLVYKWELLKAVGMTGSTHRAYEIIKDELRLLACYSVTRKAEGELIVSHLIGSFKWPKGNEPVEIWIDEPAWDIFHRARQALIQDGDLSHCAESAGWHKIPKELSAAPGTLGISRQAGNLFYYLLSQPATRTNGKTKFIHRDGLTCFEKMGIRAVKDSKLRDKRKAFIGYLKEMIRAGYVIGIKPTPQKLDSMKWGALKTKQIAFEIFSNPDRTNEAIRAAVEAVQDGK